MSMVSLINTECYSQGFKCFVWWTETMVVSWTGYCRFWLPWLILLCELHTESSWNYTCQFTCIFTFHAKTKSVNSLIWENLSLQACQNLLNFYSVRGHLLLWFILGALLMCYEPGILYIQHWTMEIILGLITVCSDLSLVSFVSSQHLWRQFTAAMVPYI